MSNLVSDKFKSSLKSSLKDHIINFLERKRLSGSPYERQPERLISAMCQVSCDKFFSFFLKGGPGENSFFLCA